MFLVVESYSENGKKLVATFKAPAAIISSSISFSNCYNCTILAIACQDNAVYFLKSDLLLITKTEVPFKVEDLELPGYEIKGADAKYVEHASVQSVLTPFAESFLVGYENGFIKEYSFKTFLQVKVYNPIALEYPRDGSETKSLTVDDIAIPGTLFLNYGNHSELIFANHKKNIISQTGQVTNLPQTPVIYYKHNDGTAKKFKVTGDILAARILENRNHYLCLTSNSSELYIYNFYKEFLIMKVSLDIMKNPQLPLYFTGLAVHEFGMNERNQPVSTVFPAGGESREIIDGDVIIGVENSGSILISKLIYESQNGKISFAPIKYINAKGESKVPKNNTIMVSRSVYNRSQDKLMFSDQQSEVVVISNILKTTFAEQKPSS